MTKKFNARAQNAKLQEYMQNPVPYKTRTYRGKALEDYIAPFSLDDLQKNVLVGVIFGDGSLSLNKGKNYNYKFDLEAASLDYVNLVYSIFSYVVGTPPSPRYINGILHSYWFRTYRLPSLKFYADTFSMIDPQTQKRRRRIPSNIHQFLNPMVLAFWFMDDGSMNPTRSGCYLHTECFPKEEVMVLQSALGRVFGFETSLHKDDRTKKKGKIYSKLYISQKSTREFVKLISPYVIPCMRSRLRKFEDDISNDI